MKRLRLNDVIHKIDEILLMIVVACFVLGGFGWLIQLIRFGTLFGPGGE